MLCATQTNLGGLDASGTEPEDWVEGPGEVGELGDLDPVVHR